MPREDMSAPKKPWSTQSLVVGRIAMFSIQTRDIPILKAAILVVTAIYAFANLIADLCYALLNPKIRFGRNAA